MIFQPVWWSAIWRRHSVEHWSKPCSCLREDAGRTISLKRQWCHWGIREKGWCETCQYHVALKSTSAVVLYIHTNIFYVSAWRCGSFMVPVVFLVMKGNYWAPYLPPYFWDMIFPWKFLKIIPVIHKGRWDLTQQVCKMEQLLLWYNVKTPKPSAVWAIETTKASVVSKYVCPSGGCGCFKYGFIPEWNKQTFYAERSG